MVPDVGLSPKRVSILLFVCISDRHLLSVSLFKLYFHAQPLQNAQSNISLNYLPYKITLLWML